MAGKATAALAALVLAGALAPVGVARELSAGGGNKGTATPPAALSPSGRPPSPSARNVRTRGASGGSAVGGENADLALIILFALGALVVLVVIPSQLAKGIAARRRAAEVLSRSARSGTGNRPNGA